MLDFRPLQSALRNNPFYLLSALSMLLGCLALSQSLTFVPGQWTPLVGLIGVLQVYEFLLLGLALYLNRRGQARADATTMFLLGLLFLVDATHLNAELAASHPSAALAVSTALYALAVVKLHLMRNALELTSRRAFAVTVAQVALLLFLPVTVRILLTGELHTLGLGPDALSRTLFVLWWIVGSIPIVYLWVHRNPDRPRDPSALWIARVALVLPLASIVAHLVLLHWIYALPFHASYVTPLLLGASTYASIAFARSLDRYRPILRWALPMVAVLFSLGSLRIALVGLALVWLVHRATTGETAFGRAAAGAFLLALSGDSPRSIMTNWAAVLPKNGVQLGTAGMIAAFAFLALGFARSLLRTGPSDDRSSEDVHFRETSR